MQPQETNLKLSLIIWTALAAFMFKVWNERQMTTMYERQAVALEEIATQAKPLYLKTVKPTTFDCIAERVGTSCSERDTAKAFWSGY